MRSRSKRRGENFFNGASKRRRKERELESGQAQVGQEKLDRSIHHGKTASTQVTGRTAVHSILGPNAAVYSFPAFLKTHVPLLYASLIASSASEEPWPPHHPLRHVLMVPSDPTLECPVLNKIRLPVRHEQSLSSLIDDIVWTLLQKKCQAKVLSRVAATKDRRDRPVLPSRKSLRQQLQNNLLCLGYVMASDHCFPDQADGTHYQDSRFLPMGGKMMMMLQINTQVDYCKTSPLIHDMYHLTGDDVFRFILLHTSIFIPLPSPAHLPESKSNDPDLRDDDQRTTVRALKPNRRLGQGNYLQITGPPIHTIATAARMHQVTLAKPSPPTAGKHEAVATHAAGAAPRAVEKHPMDCTETAPGGSSPPRKNRRRARAEDGERKRFVRPKQLEPSSTLSRHLLFYRDAHVPHVGLPKNHSLERCQPADASHLLTAMLSDLQGHASFAAYRAEILSSSTALSVAQQLVRRHRKIDYHRLLNRYCPLPNNLSQLSLADLSACHVPHRAVTSFLQACLRRLFRATLKPDDDIPFWGSSANRDRVLSDLVPEFVRLRRQETMANKNIVSGIRVTLIKWLCPQSTTRLSRHDHERLQCAVLGVLRWLFRDYIIALCQSIFYVTETEMRGKVVMYYRKPVWAMFRSLSMRKLTVQEKQYVEITEQEALQRLETQQMGLSRLRLVPKATGVRPIATLCKSEFLKVTETGPSKLVETHQLGPSFATDKTDSDAQLKHSQTLPAHVVRKHGAYLSTNAILRDAFAVLKYEHSNCESTFGYGVHGLHYFYPKYRRFLEEIRSRPTQEQQIYFASIDIHHCYDNINQQHLLEVLQNLLTEEDYMIQTYTATHPFESIGQVMRTVRQEVFPTECFEPFGQAASTFSGQHHRSVLSDSGQCTTVQKTNLLDQFREHLSSHLLIVSGRYKNRYLLQCKGIPQGSVLSTMLCNFYYGSIEPEIVKGGSEANGSGGAGSDGVHLLSRMVDDFAIFTTNVANACNFIQTMNRGIPRLGVIVNKEKTRLSFNVATVNGQFEQNGNVAAHNGFFPWCGMLFEVSSGEVRIDYSRFGDGKAGDSLSVDTWSNEGQRILFQMKLFVRPRCLPILFDAFINSETTQVINFYQLLFLAAVKTVEYSRSFKKKRANVSYLIKCIEDTVSYTFKLICQRLRSVQPGSCPRLSPLAISWIGCRAFHDAFAQLEDFTAVKSVLSLHVCPREFNYLGKVLKDAYEGVHLVKEHLTKL